LRTLSKKASGEVFQLGRMIERKRRNGEDISNLSSIRSLLIMRDRFGTNGGYNFSYESPKTPVKIDIGCGVRKKEGFIGLDEMAGSAADVVADLTKGLPFKDNSVDEVWSNHFLEHLTIDEVCNLMEEIHRVCKPWAFVEIRVPHFSGLTNFYEFHKTSFRYNSFAEFTLGGGGMFDSHAQFYLQDTKINIVNRQSPKLRPQTKWLIWNYPIEWIVNKMPLFYELTGFRNLFPAWEIVFKMRVVK
jgi:SAM-dependent methyltransferase